MLSTFDALVNIGFRAGSNDHWEERFASQCNDWSLDQGLDSEGDILNKVSLSVLHLHREDSED